MAVLICIYDVCIGSVVSGSDRVKYLALYLVMYIFYYDTVILRRNSLVVNGDYGYSKALYLKPLKRYLMYLMYCIL